MLKSNQLQAEGIEDLDPFEFFDQLMIPLRQGQTSISATEIIEIFHVLYYIFFMNAQGNSIEYKKVPIYKNPSDLFNYQQIIFSQRPDYVIECGSFEGGSTLFFAETLDLIGKGQVISIDICDREETWHPRIKEHKRIQLIKGSSTDENIVSQVNTIIKDSKSNFVILDSDHSKDHVLQEMQMYSKFLFPGNYMVVEDSNLSGNPIPYKACAFIDGGPLQAIDDFMDHNSQDFMIDNKYDGRFLFSFAPHGYIRKL